MFIDFKERGREKEKYVREKHQSVASHMNLQASYVAWLGFELAIFWCTGQHSNQLSHLARTGM